MEWFKTLRQDTTTKEWDNLDPVLSRLLPYARQQIFGNDTKTPFVNSLFKVVMSPGHVLEEEFTNTNITWAAGLDDVLASSQPPTVEWFKTLRQEFARDDWAVYIVVMEDEDEQGHKLYVGMAANWTDGARARTQQYTNPKCRHMMPFNVRRSLDEGWHVSFVGALATCPKPPVRVMNITRMVLQILEASVASIFWAMRRPDLMYGYVSRWSDWQPHDMDWTGLCSHSALFEGWHGNQRLSVADQEELERKRVQRVIDRRARVISEKQHHCDDCDESFGCASLLERHLGTIDHVLLVGAEDEESVRRALDITAANEQRSIAAGLACVPCQQYAQLARQLELHTYTPKHARMTGMDADEARGNERRMINCRLTGTWNEFENTPA